MNFSLLKEYGFMELWNPEVLLLLAVIGFLYLQVVGPWRHRFTGAEPVSSRQKGLFISGLAVYYLALGSPLDIIAHHYMFSAHIFQQSMMLFAAPPLILLGIPAWLVRPVFNHPGFKKPLAVLTQPIFAAFLFNALLSFYHLPLIFDFATANEAFGTLYHTVLVITAFQVWWSITCPRPESTFIVVVLPAPFGPRKPTISPLPIWKLISSTALTVRKRRRNKLFSEFRNPGSRT